LVAGANGRLYAVGGTDWTGHLAAVDEYEPTTNSWRTRAAMPTRRARLGLATGVTGRLYAAGGYNEDGGFLAVVEEYDLSTNSWSTRTAMPTARYGLGLAAGANGKLYAVGGVMVMGSIHRGIVATVEEYDPVTDTWATRAPMPTARSGLGLVRGANGRLYAFGGSMDVGGLGVVVARLEEYDPITDVWATRWSAPQVRTALGRIPLPDRRR
jgi:N-acetylneuraminic acid mutarotase